MHLPDVTSQVRYIPIAMFSVENDGYSYVDEGNIRNAPQLTLQDYLLCTNMYMFKLVSDTLHYKNSLELVWSGEALK